MAKVVLPTIQSGYLSTESLNESLTAITSAIENTLSRDGTAPNQMDTDLDMNGHSILNLSVSGGSDSLVTLEFMQDYVDSRASGLLTQLVESQVATTDQSTFTLETFSYVPGVSNLVIYVDGIRKFTTDYVETDETTITFNTPFAGGEEVVFVSTEFLATVNLPPHTHTWSDITNIPDFASRWPTWSEVTGKPTTFTPATHVHSTADITSGTGLADARRGVWVQASEPIAGRVGELWIW